MKKNYKLKSISLDKKKHHPSLHTHCNTDNEYSAYFSQPEDSKDYSFQNKQFNLFPNPDEIKKLFYKHAISKQEAQLRKQQYFEREERKKKLINEPFMQVYLSHLKKNKLRLPSILQ